VCWGLTRGIIPTVFHSRYAVRTRITKKASGSHVTAKSAAWCIQSPTISLRLSAAGMDPLTELGRDLRRGTKLDAALPPKRGARLGSGHIETLRGVLHEHDAAAALEEAADRCVVADIGRHAEHDDLLRIERVEERIGVRVREHVEVLLQQEDLASALDEL